MKTLQQQEINAISGGCDVGGVGETEIVDDVTDISLYPHVPCLPCPILPIIDFPRKPRTL
jgi:hypothetical protein